MPPRRDALGGDLFCSLMAALNFQLPFEAMQAVSCWHTIASCKASYSALHSVGMRIGRQ